MKASLILSIILFSVTENALHIPADVSMEHPEAMLCVEASSCTTLFRRGKGTKAKGPTVPPTRAKTDADKWKAANEKFQVMKNHIFYGKDAKNRDEAPDKGRHTVTAYCKANPKATGECSTETHLCHISAVNKSLWDDREGRHTHADIENHCTNAILNHDKIKQSYRGHVVLTAAGHHICIKYTPGNNIHGSGTCYNAGVNIPQGGLVGDVCEHTGNTAADKTHTAALKCSDI